MSSEKYGILFPIGHGSGYLYVKTLEPGAHAEVELVYNIDKKSLAVRKHIPVEGKHLPQNEIDIGMWLMDCPYIPRLEALEFGSSGVQGMVSEYCDCGDVPSYMKRHVDQSNAAAFFTHILSQMMDIYELLLLGPYVDSITNVQADKSWVPVCHGDTHLHNIFLQSIDRWNPPRVMLGDFGQGCLCLTRSKEVVARALSRDFCFFLEDLSNILDDLENYSMPMLPELISAMLVMTREQGLPVLLRSPLREEARYLAVTSLLSEPRFPTPIGPTKPYVFASPNPGPWTQEASLINRLGKGFRWIQFTGDEDDFSNLRFVLE